MFIPPTMLLRLSLLCLASWLPASLLAQSYTSWIVGDTADAVPAHWEGGIVLAGGGGDHDEAMRWMLSRAGGGDVVVLRASRSDGYNDYFYSDLGVPVNSVETIRFEGDSAAWDPYVLRRIAEAEVLFLAGGDQYDYYRYWKDTPVATAINALLTEKRITVGGSSAGMAILGGAYYTPSGPALTATDALTNPYHPAYDTLGKGDFLQAPFLADVVTDTHYGQRQRQGRHVGFMARLIADFGGRSYGIACNEYTTVCMDTLGQARVFGDYPDYQDFAYFLQATCQPDFAPEVILPGQPLTWDRNQAAVIVCRLPGRADGTNTFDLTDWETQSGGTWMNWYVQQGVLDSLLAPEAGCGGPATALAASPASPFRLFPNPCREVLHIQGPAHPQVRLFDSTGRQCLSTSPENGQLDLRSLAPGPYWLELQAGPHRQRSLLQRLP